ncbi:MAG: BACON domain-containing protein [Pyrinomonadaceae bacterium]
MSGFSRLPEKNPPNQKTITPGKTDRKNSVQGDQSSVVGSGEAATASAFVEVKTALNKENLSSLPALSPEQLRAREESEEDFESVPVRQGEAAKPGPISPLLESAMPSVVRPSNDGTAGPSDMTYFLTHNITSSEVSTTQRSTIQEPSVVNMNSTVFFTANWYAAKSSNSGSSFTYVNPYTLFPNVNGGFCCDQVTSYAPSQDMALWGVQYVKDSHSGTFRLERAIGSSGVANDNWVYYDFTPQMVGFASGNWFDFPSLTVGANYLYVTSNVYRTSDDGFTGSAVMRIPLSNLAAGTSFNFNYFTSTSLGSFRCTEGATTTIYFAAFNTTSQMRVHRWDESSGTIFWDDVNLNAFTYLSRNGVATSPDGTNWAARADSRPLAAYVANGIIGVMFMAKQDANFPYPYTIHARFNQSTRALVSQGQIWNPNYAWLYPSAAPNAAGNVAGTLQIGGGTVANGFPYPGTQVWIIDDIQPITNGQVGGVYLLSSSNAGPSNNAWGDFFTVRPHKSFPNTWVCASYSLSNGQGGSNTVPNYTWFGRGRDATVCSYSINPTSNSVAGTGGTGSITVTTGAGCSWTATPNVSWISISSGGSGSGSGTVNYSVQANNTTSSRSGTISIADQTFTVNQSAGSSSTGLHFYPLLSPIRLLDTRSGELACDAPGSPLVGGGVRTEQAILTCSGIPATAQAIAGNIAVVNTLSGSGSGYITLYPSNVTRPLAANINYVPGQIINNFFTVGLASNGTFNIYAFTTTHLVIDITGYYAP